MYRNMLFSCALATLVSLSLGTSAFAQTPTNQITYFTFSAPFELPGGKTLPAGKYTFKIVDSPSNRHVVQILSEDGRTMYATLLAIPAQRQDPPNEPEVRFMETAANMPPAIRTWWYPGRTIGHEFIYPKGHARRLAGRQRDSVLTVSTEATTNDTMQTADLARINATGLEQVWTAETAAEVAAPTTRVTEVTTAAETSTAQTTTAQASRVPMTTEVARVETTRTELPRTSTVLPLVGLLGFVSMAGATALRLRRRQ